MSDHAPLTGPSAEGAAAYVDVDLYDPERILAAAAETLDAAAAQTLDLTRPTALILSGILGHVADHDEARSLVRRLPDGLPSGRFLCVNDDIAGWAVSPEKQFGRWAACAGHRPTDQGE
ncbi:SAM-dependent methyltransferase [Streptomyces camelliae]|uniref:SAM-dependent methyltransferase n=1 Tax=Streptomyces camelliae TaxID=3004093 RepID=UPI003D16A398